MFCVAGKFTITIISKLIKILHLYEDFLTQKNNEMKKLLIIAIAIISLMSCNKNSTRIEGKLTNGKGTKLELYNLDPKFVQVFVDSVKVNNDGSFKIDFEVEETTFMMLHLDKKTFITLVVSPGDKIKVAADKESFAKKYKVEGSEDSKLVQQLEERKFTNMDKIKAFNSRIDKLKERTPENIYKINKEYLILFNLERQYIKEFVKKNAGSFASIKALWHTINDKTHLLTEKEDMPFFELVNNSLLKKYPENGHVKRLNANINSIKEKIAAEDAKENVTAIGKKIANVSLPGVDGKNISFYSKIEGYTLVYFWSATDKKSIKLNDGLKTLYAKYKSKGFNIYAISLDQNNKLWQNTIKRQKLNWDNVIEETSQVSAMLYNVKRLPTMVLVDKDAKVVAKKFSVDELKTKLAEVLK